MVVATCQVGAAHTAFKECVATDEDLLFGIVETNSTGRMTGSCYHIQVALAKSHSVSFLEGRTN